MDRPQDNHNKRRQQQQQQNLSRTKKGGGRVTAFNVFLWIVFLFASLSLFIQVRVSTTLLGEVGQNKKNDDDGRSATSTARDNTGSSSTRRNNPSSSSLVAELSCDRYGGPYEQDAAQEMVYWSDIPSDAARVSPFLKKKPQQKQYLTFEPDLGGWNNIRMAMETVLAMAAAMGRTLVLPMETSMYLLDEKTTNVTNNKNNKNNKQQGQQGQQQRHHFSFHHFFPMESIHKEHPGLDIITMEQFLQETATKGWFRDDDDNSKILFPPDDNRTDWNGCDFFTCKRLFRYLRKVSHLVLWDPDDCMVAFPSSIDPKDIETLYDYQQQTTTHRSFDWQDFVGKPLPVNASTLERMKEQWANRNKLCVYDQEMQQETLLHFPSESNHELQTRLLVHFYAFLFFQDYQQDLWTKRFIRDHVRYTDEIQCAAARVIQAIRQRVEQNKQRRQQHRSNFTTRYDNAGYYDSFHIRRGDFQFKETRVDAEEILTVSQKKLQRHDTLYIATDEKDKSFFKPLIDYYDEVLFLDDFLYLLTDINSNYYGMIDQLIASKGRYFFGCWFSTFTGYINRLRGYHANLNHGPGYDTGRIDSWYYAPSNHYFHMQVYYPVKQQLWAREFPTSWRLIDEMN